ncbi:MAG TPA: sugar ABC transporter ATP-binding protein [Solirubrobacteraceae bacterium]|jgi:ABC-type sugar transport system ATPase subunit
MSPAGNSGRGAEDATGAASAQDPGAARSGAPLVSVTGIAKTFGVVQALRGVDLEIYPGEVHGLIGANGAGKSTLIRVLAGVVAPDAGALEIDGQPTPIADPRDSTELGFQFLHQELNLVPKFDALHNMSLGLVGRSRFGLADRARTFKRARTVAAEIGLDFPLDTPVDDLPVAQQWLVALGRSLMRRARLIAFDEPTASLSAKEAEKLFSIIARMKQDGIAVLYVSHRLEEIELLSDRVTAFRDGRVVARFRPHEITRGTLIEAITGGEADATSVAPAQDAEAGAVVLGARGLVRRPAVMGVSLDLRAKEIAGVAGLVGAGRTELARLLFGADRPEEGELFLDGKQIRVRSPADANRLGIGLVPEERRSQALFLDKDATFNINIAAGPSLRVARRGNLISMRRARAQARTTAERVDLRPPNVDTTVRKLSGGNQQKLALGRWLLGRRRVLILDEPTRGVDVGARSQIHRMLRALAEDGMALLVISSDFEELLSCDRVLVMHLGRIVEELRGEAITQARMLRAAYGQQPQSTTPAATGTMS